MTIEQLSAALMTWRGILVPLANLGSLSEPTLAGYEHMMVQYVGLARDAQLQEADILATAAPLLEVLIEISASASIPLSDETEELIQKARTMGTFLPHVARPATRPLAQAPTQPLPPEFSVFVDESGDASFDQPTQPVLSLVGVIFKDETIAAFEKEADALLITRGLPRNLEIHASEFLTTAPKGVVASLSLDDRYRLLREFLALGMRHAASIHHMTMLKATMAPKYRQKLSAQGLNAYTATVVWFLITLDRACFDIVDLGARCKYFYDRTDAHRKDVGRIFRAAEAATNPRMRIIKLKGPPRQLESHLSRPIQLADVAGYFLKQYRQFEMRTFKRREELNKHEGKIREMYALIQPKLAEYIRRDLWRFIDWQALADFSLKPSTPTRPRPTGRRRR